MLVSDGQREDAEHVALEQGARVPSAGEVARDALIALGVLTSKVIVLTGWRDNTSDEAAGLRDYALQHGWKKVIVVTSKLHTRRAGFAMRRAVAGTEIRILMRASRYDTDNPARCGSGDPPSEASCTRCPRSSPTCSVWPQFRERKRMGPGGPPGLQIGCRLRERAG